MSTSLDIRGSVLVHGAVHEDNEIIYLIGRDTEGWRYTGNVSPKQGCIRVTVDGDENTFKGATALQATLAFLGTLK